MNNNYGILLILLLPVLGGMVAFWLGKKDAVKRNDLIDIVTGCELLTLGYLCYAVFVKQEKVSLELNDLFGLGLLLALDGMRLFFCILATLVFGVISQFMKESMKQKDSSNRFYLFFMATYTMVLGAFMSTSMFNFIMFIVFAMLFLYPMIMHREDKAALKNAKFYLSFTMIGLAFLLIGMVFIYAGTGSVSYLGIYAYVAGNGLSILAYLGGLIMVIGFAIYAGLFPVQFQITRGCSSSLMEASAVITGVVSKFGVIGIMVLAGSVFTGDAFCGRFLLGFGLLTTIWGLIISLSVTDIRKILMGLNVVANGFTALGISMMILCGRSNGYAVRGSLYMMIVSAFSLLILYMVAMEQVCKVKTYEINGLIASGKENKLLAVICLLACVNLAGVPGTAGFLAHSMIYKTVLTNVGWKWLSVVYIVLWAFLMTAVTRVFMKLFVSKKEESMKILSAAKETEAAEEQEKTETLKAKKAPNAYRAGEIMLVVIGGVQILISLLPNMTVDKLSGYIRDFFRGENIVDAIPYYTSDVLISFAIAAVLCVLLYINLVHGILLRIIRNKKNKSLQKKMEEE